MSKPKQVKKTLSKAGVSGSIIRKSALPKAGITFDPNLIIERNDLNLLEKIGEGGCGEVYRAEHINWGVLAVKKLGVRQVEEG